MRYDASRDDKLKYTIQYAYENSPYYHELLDDHNIDPTTIETLDDIPTLPVTTGDDIIQNQPPNTRQFRFATDADTRRPIQSTGTRGTPKTVLTSPDDWDIRIRSINKAYHDAFNITADDTVATFLPYIGFNVSAPITTDALKEIGAAEIPFATTPLPPHVQEAVLKQHNPNVMITSTSGAYRKAKKFQHNDTDPSQLGINKIVLAGEPLTYARKQAIEDLYDATVYEIYPSTESSNAAYQCPENPNVMHTVSEHAYIELLDDNNDPVDPGEWGRIIFTRLLPPGAESKMPILRYDLSDRAKRVTTPDCNCDTDHGISFTPPKRDAHEVNVGQLDLNHQTFASQLYDDPHYANRIGESLIEVDYNDDTGKHVLTFKFERMDPSLQTTTATDITRDTDPDSEAYAFGQRLLDNIRNLGAYVDQQDQITFNVAVVDEIEQPPGKPVRVRNQS